MSHYKQLIAIISIAFLFSCSEKEHIDEKGNFNTSKSINITNDSDQLDSITAEFPMAKTEELKEEIQQFYNEFGNRSRWLYQKESAPITDFLLKELQNAMDYGLYPSTYAAEELQSRIYFLYQNENRTEAEIAALDAQITATFLLFTKHLIHGRIVPKSYEKNIWRTESQTTKLKMNKILRGMTDSQELRSLFDTIHPHHPYFEKLRNHLRKVNAEKPRDIKTFEIQNVLDFKVGYTDSTVALIRHNLEQWNIPITEVSNPFVVDSSLLKSIALFQKSRSIKVDGLPGQNTLTYLNMTHDKLQDLIALNLERIRWLPNDFGSNYLIVNIPEFILRAFNEGKIDLKMKVVVGKKFNPTPIFHDTLKYLVFRPTWTVPQSIIENEMIPKLAKNKSHYSEKFELFESDQEISFESVKWDSDKVKNRYFVMRQKSGPTNALGLVKFIMPNDLSIYLHDTPADRYFEEEERALSHGCIRLDEPELLANYVLRNDDNWDKEKIHEALFEGETKQVNLKNELPVQIAYLTTWADDNDDLVICEDVYGFDKLQLAELEKFK